MLQLNEHLCFSLYACSRAISRLYRPLLEEMGITYPQYLVLLSLWERDGRTVKELGEQLDLDSGTLTPLLRRMEVNELIRRVRSTEDERVVLVLLTEKGLALKGESDCIPSALLSASGMSIEDVSKLNKTIKELVEKVVHTSGK